MNDPTDTSSVAGYLDMIDEDTAGTAGEAFENVYNQLRSAVGTSVGKSYYDTGMEAYQNEDPTEVAKLYADWNPDLIADAGMQEFVSRIRTDMEATGYQVLAELGNEARDAGNAVTALDYYQKSLEIKADNPQVLYDMANVYNSAGEEEKAKELWGRVIMEYPDTDLAAAAKEARGY